ncbi:MAG: hypothetical protein FWF10_11180 [Clostridiales bacterium]|nr:hypothetical protein [Clostridiales bacterium]
MKKKVLALLLALMLLLPLLACSGSETPPTNPTDPPIVQEVTPAPDPDPDPPAGFEVIDAGLFSVTCPEGWTYNEEKSNIYEKSANLRFAVLGEDDKEIYGVTIDATPDSAKWYRRAFTGNGIDLRDLAEGKLPGISIDGTTFYESKPGETYRYRHDVSGVNYYVQFSGAKDADLNAAPFSDIIAGITLHLTDTGEAVIPWPWEGEPWTPTLAPQMAGTFTLTAEYLEADHPIILNTIMDTSFTVVDDMIYTVTKHLFSAYRIGDGSVALQNSVVLEEDFELIRTDGTKQLYLSQGIWDIFVYDRFTRVNAPAIRHDLVMHKSGEWGITFWVNADPMKVTVQDGIFREEPWVLSDLSKAETRTGFFKMISDIRITDSYIIVAGSAADDSGHKIMVYDHNGNEKFVLENIKEDRSGLGSVTGIVETPNGFLATDGNMRDIVLWNKNGTYIGSVDVKKLLGANYCWLEDMHQMNDDSILIAISQERADKSADELLFFRLTGF